MKQSFTTEDIENNIKRLFKCFPEIEKGYASEIYKIRETIADNYTKLAFPEHPNWTYCIPIIPNYTCKDGEILDLGIHIYDNREKHYPLINISNNFVSSNEGADYESSMLAFDNEQSKKVLLTLLKWDIINEEQLMYSLCNHNGMIMKFLKSDLTAWDMQEWIDQHTTK